MYIYICILFVLFFLANQDLFIVVLDQDDFQWECSYSSNKTCWDQFNVIEIAQILVFFCYYHNAEHLHIASYSQSSVAYYIVYSLFHKRWLLN